MSEPVTDGRILHITLPKCGSQWVRDVLCAPELIACGTPPHSGVHVNLAYEGLPEPPPGSLTGPVYAMNRADWLAWKRPGDRAVVVLRDPRDRLVSDIFSKLYSHNSTPRVDAQRAALRQAATLDRQIDMEIAFFNHARFYRSWAGCRDEDILPIRYEDLLRDEQAAFARIVAWLGWDVPEATLRAVVERLSFERRSGRARGETDLFSHYRRGVAGDWRNHFDRERGALWERLYPGLLETTGYETDGKWWESLPGRREDATEQPPDELTVARKRLTSLERQLAEKEAEIRSLSGTCGERLALIERMAAELDRNRSAAADHPPAPTESAPPPEPDEGLKRIVDKQAESLQTLTRLLHRLTGIDAQPPDEFGESPLLPALDALDANYREALVAKEKTIREQARALRAYRLAVERILCIPLMVRFRDRLRNALRPRLGNLDHHPPRPIRCLPPLPRISGPQTAPRISIVVPSFNQGDFIGRTLRSIAEQDYPNLEVYVQDGGSPDRTVEILESWTDRLAGWASGPDAGQSDAINRAFAKTSGEIMAWLNSDDLLLPGALHCVADFFLRHPEVDVVYGDRILIDGEDREIGCWHLPAHDDAILSWVDYVPQETLFWRRRIWEQAGGCVDESFRFAMDWDLLVRFRDAGARFAHLDRFLGAFRIHAQQKTSAVIDEIGHAEMNRIRERCLGYVPTQGQIRRAAAPYLFRHLLQHYARGVAQRRTKT